MLHRETNQYGTISIDEAVVEAWIDEAFRPFERKAWLAHYRGAVSDVMVRLRNFDALADHEIRMTEKGLFIRLYVIVRFGSSIRAVTTGLMDRLAERLFESLELPVDNIEVVVTGVLSKNIAKRWIVSDYRTVLNERVDLR